MTENTTHASTVATNTETFSTHRGLLIVAVKDAREKLGTPEFDATMETVNKMHNNLQAYNGPDKRELPLALVHEVANLRIEHEMMLRAKELGSDMKLGDLIKEMAKIAGRNVAKISARERREAEAEAAKALKRAETAEAEVSKTARQLDQLQHFAARVVVMTDERKRHVEGYERNNNLNRSKAFGWVRGDLDRINRMGHSQLQNIPSQVIEEARTEALKREAEARAKAADRRDEERQGKK